MSITLDEITLPEDMVWDDEFAWNPIAQRASFTLTGALRIKESTRQAGRPITLALPSEYGDCARSLVLSLYALANMADEHTLTLHDGREFDVRWRRTDGEPVDGKSAHAGTIHEYADPAAGDQYSLILRFIEV